MSLKVGIVGCGIVGAAIAYELSRVPDLAVTVCDRRAPQTWEATGAALGVLMAAISQKRQGRALQLRLSSLQRYETLIPELEGLTQELIPYNRQGILRLCFDSAELVRWQQVAVARSGQDFSLEILDPVAVAVAYPDIAPARVLETGNSLAGAVYSPQDRQVDPVRLTQALVKAAQMNGAEVLFQSQVQGFTTTRSQQGVQVGQIQTPTGLIPVDWLVLAAGLGSMSLSTTLEQRIELHPVLGQALHLRLQEPLPYPRPVISGEDVHLVPLNSRELWVGATVEFPPETNLEAAQPNPQRLETVRQQAIALCPQLKTATVLSTWSGLRPRPYNRPAPLIEPLPEYKNVLLATGHYRNGVLLAPITALKIRELLNAA